MNQPLTPLDVRPVTLTGAHIRLEPLDESHAEGLGRHLDLSYFDYFTTIRPRSADEAGARGFIRELQSAPNVVPFALVLVETGEPIGSTTFMDIRPEHRALEIGMTWIARRHQGTRANPEMKRLLLQHAFETLGCERVQLKCDGRNLQSQAAIRKLGAKFEGVLRKHIILPDGFVRDTVMFSIVAEEWPTVRDGLIRRLAD